MFRNKRSEQMTSRLIDTSDIEFEVCGSQCLLPHLPGRWYPIPLGKHPKSTVALTDGNTLWIPIVNKERDDNHVLGALKSSSSLEVMQRMLDLKANPNKHVLQLLECCECTIRVPKLEGQMLLSMSMGPNWASRLDYLDRELKTNDGVRVAKELAEGLLHLHTHGIAHGDPFPFNCVIQEDTGTAIWIDLQDSTELTAESELTDLAAFFIYTVAPILNKLESLSEQWVNGINEILRERPINCLLNDYIKVSCEIMVAHQDEEAIVTYPSAGNAIVESMNSRKDLLGAKVSQMLIKGLYHWQEAFVWNADEAKRLAKVLELENVKADVLLHEVKRITNQEKKELEEALVRERHEKSSIERQLEDQVAVEAQLQRQITMTNELHDYSTKLNHQVKDLTNGIRFYQTEIERVLNSRAYRFGKAVSLIKYPKRLARKVIRGVFSTANKRVSPEMKRMLKPYIHKLYKRAYPERQPFTHAHVNEAIQVSVNKQQSIAPKSTQDSSLLAFFQDKEQLKVSVILPVYNHANMLRLSINSVLNQTYQNYELIVLNDGSTDDVESVLDEFVSHPKVRVFTQQNQKLPRALTNAFMQATGDLYTWTSADNLCKPQMLERMVDYMLLHPEAAMVYANYEIIDENGSPLVKTQHRYHNQNPKGSNIMSLPKTVETLGLAEDNFIGAAFMYRSNVANVIGEYDPCLLGTEDYDYWLRILALFNIHKINTDEPLYEYRVHSNTLSEKFGQKEIRNNLPVLLQYHSDREKYYADVFDIFFIASGEESAAYFELASGLSGLRHRVVWLTNSEQEPPIHVRKYSLKQFSNAVDELKWNTKAISFISADDEVSRICLQRLEQLYGESLFKIGVDVCVADLDWTLNTNRNHNSADPLKSFNWQPPLENSDVLLKARDNSYYLWDYPGDGEYLLGYFDALGSLDTSFIRNLAQSRPNYDIVIIGCEENSQEAECEHLRNVFHDLSNVFVLGLKPRELRYYYLSGFDAYLLASNNLDGDKSRFALQALLHAGRRVVTNGLISERPLPFFLCIQSDEDLVSLDRLLNSPFDLEVLIRYLETHSIKHKAYFIEALANSRIFYKLTREKEKVALGIPNTPAVPYVPLQVNLLIEAVSLDKGGLEEVIYNTIKTLDSQKYKPTVVCIQAGGYVADKIRDLGVPIEVLPESGKAERYKEILHERRIQCVHQHYSTFGAPIAERAGIPVLHYLHNSYVWFTDDEIGALHSYDPSISRYIAVSEEVKRYSVGRIGIRADKVEVIPNGIAIQWLEEKFSRSPKRTREDFGLSDSDFVLLNLASIDGRKATLLTISAVIESAKQYPNLKVLMAGNTLDEGLYEKAKQMVRHSNAESHVIFTGFIPENQDLFKMADAFLLPSIIEGWSISKLEAMYAGLPLILTDVGGAAEVIEDEDIGILIPNAYGDVNVLNDRTLYEYTLNPRTNNLEALRGAIQRVYREKAIWREKGKKGTYKVKQYYDLDTIVRRYELLTDMLIIPSSESKSACAI